MVKLGKGIQLKIAEMGQDHREREERKKAACRMKLRLIRSLLSDSGGLRISRSLETFLPGDLGILTFGSFLKHVEESETSFIYQKKTRDNRDLIISSSSISLRDSIALYTAMIPTRKATSSAGNARRKNRTRATEVTISSRYRGTDLPHALGFLSRIWSNPAALRRGAAKPGNITTETAFEVTS